jgi:SAM-dependent methyltransferase
MFTEISTPSRPSLSILNTLYEYDDFMDSVDSLVDLGCGDGHDLNWWATRMTRDDSPVPLDIKCVGVDLQDRLCEIKKLSNVTYQCNNFEDVIPLPNKQPFDILWCFDAFQYCTNPLETLKKWRSIASPGAMLVISVPDTITIKHRQLAFSQPSGCYYHHTMVSLMHMLAVTGWDCRAGFFSKKINDPWTHAIVYKSEHEAMDPGSTSWYRLSELKLLPESADASIHAHGYLRQQDLLIPWIDKSLTDMSQI